MHLSLERVLPDGDVLALHRDLGFVALLTCNGGEAQMSAAQCFPPSEMATLLPLPVSYPAYCPNEQLFASFSGGTTEGVIEKARNQLRRLRPRGAIPYHRC